MKMSQNPVVKDAFFNSLTESLNFANMCVLGLPWDNSSTFRKGATQGPEYIRHATTGSLYNSYAETGIDIKKVWQIFDLGDAPISDLSAIEAKENIFQILSKYNQYNMHYFFLGGDHLSTYFNFTALKRLADKRLGLIYVDAHPDLYEHYEGNPYSHACVVRRIIDETNIEPETIFQVGIRAPTPEQTEFAKSVGINTITTKDFQLNGAKAIAESIKAKIPKYLDGVYLSIDMDILDPAYAPGVGNPESAGLTTRELVDFIQGLQGIKLPAFDLVEYSPKFDFSGITAFATAKIIKEVLSIIV